jgi:hypothetical protein
MMVLLAALIASASAEPANFHQTYSVHPLLLPLGQYQVSGEWRTADKVGVMVSPRFIRLVDYVPSGSDYTYDMIGGTLMVQGRYYLFGTFSKGWFLGGTGGGGFVEVTRAEDAAESTNATLGVGPVAGGKVGFPFGLTLDADIGLLLGEFVEAADVGDASTVSQSTFKAQPLLEVRAGWSF